MKKLLVVTFIIASAICTPAQKVKVEVDKSGILSTYKTYAWTKGMPAKNPIVNQLITDAIERQLAAKGLTKVDSGADLSILFWAASELDVHVSYADWGWTPGSGIGIPINQAWNVRQGSLEVDVLERKSLSLLWRGTATDTLSHGPTNDAVKDAKDVEKTIKKAVEKLFQKFP